MQNSETLSPVRTLPCSQNTQGRSRSSTASRLALIECSGTSSRRERRRWFVCLETWTGGTRDAQLLTECSITLRDGIATADPYSTTVSCSLTGIKVVGMSNIDKSLTTEQAKELIRLCRTGRLHDIQEWIANGRSLQIPSVSKKTLLQIAVEDGFHSLVELIAMHESSQASKNAALANAVAMRRLDLVQLLFRNGADIKSVSLADVLLG